MISPPTSPATGTEAHPRPPTPEGVRACYVGETTNMFRRAGQHFTGLRKGRKDNVLPQHVSNHHTGTKMEREDFDLDVTRHNLTPISHQTEEGASLVWEISHGQKGNLVQMNSRSEFHQPLGGIRTFTTYL